MAEIYSFPNNVDEFTGAEHLMRWFHGRTSGVWGAAGNAAVSPAGEGMQVIVSDGLGWLANSENDGIVWWNNTQKTTGRPLTLDIAPADGMLNRIDRIVVSWETTDYSKRPTISVLKGKLSGSPAVPEITNNELKRQISLAKILIPAGTVSLTPKLITDERLDPDVCGIVTESVKIDTAVMQAQFEELLALIENNLQQLLGKILPDGAVTEPKIFNGAVTASKIAPGAVNADKIAKNAVSQTYEVSILRSLWTFKNSNYEADVPVVELSADWPFFVDVNITSESADKAADLQEAFSSIFSAECVKTGTIHFRANVQPAQDIPVKIVAFKR